LLQLQRLGLDWRHVPLASTGAKALLFAALALLVPPVDTPVFLDIPFNARILGFSILVCVGAALISGIMPALQKANQGSPAYADAAKESNRLAASDTTAKYTLWGLAIASGALIVGGGCLYYFDRPSMASSATLTVSFGTGASFTANWGGSW